LVRKASGLVQNVVSEFAPTSSRKWQRAGLVAAGAEVAVKQTAETRSVGAVLTVLAAATVVMMSELLQRGS
jgi:hypothetical protein